MFTCLGLAEWSPSNKVGLGQLFLQGALTNHGWERIGPTLVLSFRARQRQNLESATEIQHATVLFLFDAIWNWLLVFKTVFKRLYFCFCPTQSQITAKREIVKKLEYLQIVHIFYAHPTIYSCLLYGIIILQNFCSSSLKPKPNKYIPKPNHLLLPNSGGSKGWHGVARGGSCHRGKKHLAAPVVTLFVGWLIYILYNMHNVWKSRTSSHNFTIYSHPSWISRQFQSWFRPPNHQRVFSFVWKNNWSRV